MKALTKSLEWTKLVEHFAVVSKQKMKDMFADSPERFERFSIEFEDILFDFSKNIINDETISLLLKLAEAADVKSWIEKMFAGEKINCTEGRAVLHVALRNLSNTPMRVDGWDVMPKVNAVLGLMNGFVDDIHSGRWVGLTGNTITDVVNIGIGGSDLGPKMVCAALLPYAKPGINVHFVSNVDGTHITETLKKLDPERTLFVIASKTFTTQETLANANTAKKWFLKTAARHESDIAKHFIAISTNEKAVTQFGIDPANMFGFWNWVGGRYSLWSAIGMPIALQIGMEHFEELLAGAHAMDQHFRNEPLERNIPVIMALLGIWYINFYNARTCAIIPYDQYLEKFPDFLQQLDMESNGKSVSRNGELLNYHTGPVIWGRIGTDSQHSFFQLIHQGTRFVPIDFLAPVRSKNPTGNHHEMLLSNVFAQSQALMMGKTHEQVVEELRNDGLTESQIENLAQHKVFPGNKPSNTFLYKEVTPRTLGTLIAMYEHKVFVQGIIWDVNSFDQWGVELVKQLAGRILPELASSNAFTGHDSSTNGLINYFKKYR